MVEDVVVAKAKPLPMAEPLALHLEDDSPLMENT